MFLTLMEKEWKSVLLSPKFALTFAASTILILLSIGVGIREYRAFAEQQAAGRQLLDEELQEQTSWMGVASRAYREADPLQIFVSGVHNDIGRVATIHSSAEARLDQSVYSDDPVLAVFRSLDLTFIFQAVLSLFAILFTYDAINGERESGTLRLVFSSAVARPRFVLAKFLGTWLGLAVPLALPVLLGILAVVLLRVPMTGDDWGRLALFLGASALYFTFFMAFGIAVSALTKRPATSFLVLLVSWVMLVLVIPRAALMASVELVPVPTVAEIESQKAGFEGRAWEKLRRSLEERWRERRARTEGLSEEEQEAFEDNNLWGWMEEDEKERKELQAEIAEYSNRLNEDLRNRKAEQERLAFTLSRFSPASAYRLVAMNLAGTGTALKSRYEAAARGYKQDFVRFVEEGSGGNAHTIAVRRGGGGSQVSFGGQSELDLSGMPRFVAPRPALAEAVASSPVELGLLAAQSLLCFVFGFVGFLRYDVR